MSSIEVIDTLSSEAEWKMGPPMESISGSVKAIAVQKDLNALSSLNVKAEPIIKFGQTSMSQIKRRRMHSIGLQLNSYVASDSDFHNHPIYTSDVGFAKKHY